MKKDVQNYLTEKGKADYFTHERYDKVYEVMGHGMKQDEWLKTYLSLDPLNKAQWICDHIIKLVELNKI